MSNGMKEEPTLSRMREMETIYEGGWFDHVHRIRSSQEVDAAAAIDGQGKIIREMRVLNDSDSLKGISQGIAQAIV